MEQKNSKAENDITEIDFRNALIQLTEILPSVFSKMFARKISPKAFSQLPQLGEIASENVGGFLEVMREFQTTQDKSKLISELRIRTDTLVRSVLPNAPNDKPGIDYLIEQLEGYAGPLANLGYFEETSYIDYRESLLELTRDIYLEKLCKELKTYKDTADSSSDDVFAIAQIFVTRFPSSFKLLDKPRKRFTIKTARDCISIYEDLSGQFEKNIAFVTGLIELLDGNVVSYPEIRRRGLAKNIGRVRESKYSILVSGFDKLIRNAIAHKSYVFNPNDNTVEFHDKMANIRSEISYKELVKKTKELSALVFALNELRSILVIHELRSISETLYDAS